MIKYIYLRNTINYRIIIFFLQKFLCKICKNIFLKIFTKIKFFYIIYKRIQNRISILRNILQKSNDQDLIDYTFKKILPEIFDFYMKNYINPNIIYNIDNCYKLYFIDLYNELSKNYKLTNQDALIFKKKIRKSYLYN